MQHIARCINGQFRLHSTTATAIATALWTHAFYHKKYRKRRRKKKRTQINWMKPIFIRIIANECRDFCVWAFCFFFSLSLVFVFACISSAVWRLCTSSRKRFDSQQWSEVWARAYSACMQLTHPHRNARPHHHQHHQQIQQQQTMGPPEAVGKNNWRNGNAARSPHCDTQPLYVGVRCVCAVYAVVRCPHNFLFILQALNMDFVLVEVEWWWRWFVMWGMSRPYLLNCCSHSQMCFCRILFSIFKMSIYFEVGAERMIAYICIACAPRTTT